MANFFNGKRMLEIKKPAFGNDAKKNYFEFGNKFKIKENL